ncbi:YybH family protein [Lacunimicrobium album]
MKRLVYACCIVLASIGSLNAQETAIEKPAPETEIANAVTAYVNAFNKMDSRTLASLWSSEAVYTNRWTGEVVIGRDAIQAQFEDLFKAQPQIKLEIHSESVQMLSPNVAVEHGTGKFISPKAKPEEVSYVAVYTRKDGQWLLDRVTDGDDEPVSHFEQLKVLDWMVGTWIDQDDEIRIETTCQWAKNQNFLVRSFRVTTSIAEDMAGIQIIGYDAASKKIKSWTFDSDGGYTQADWTQKNKHWFVHNKGVLANGDTASMINVIRPIDNNSFSWQTVERTVAGQLLPNVDEVLVTRIPE